MNANNRELEIWIAATIFGAEITHTPNLSTDAYMQTESDKHLMMSPHPVPSYTTDPAAALSVLEKCCNSRSVIVNNPPDGKYIIAELMRGPLGFIHPEKEIEADTLPLAICLFARKLFSKE